MKKRDVRLMDAKDNAVIIESLFKETTRNGKHTIRLVFLGPSKYKRRLWLTGAYLLETFLALTRNVLMIASSHSFGSSKKENQNESSILEIRSLHPLNSLKLSIFKKSERQTLKLCFHNKYYRYFELERSCGSKDLWDRWCKQVFQLEQKYAGRKPRKIPLNKSTSYATSTVDEHWESQKFIWNDKHLYFGSKREDEDSSRPKPVPGLGPPEDIKLLYLKPQYFGCWDQAEHWVQCESSKLLKCK